MSDLHNSFMAFRQGNQFIRLGDRGRQRLFDQHVDAALHELARDGEESENRGTATDAASTPAAISSSGNAKKHVILQQSLVADRNLHPRCRRRYVTSARRPFADRGKHAHDCGQTTAADDSDAQSAVLVGRSLIIATRQAVGKVSGSMQNSFSVVELPNRGCSCQSSGSSIAGTRSSSRPGASVCEPPPPNPANAGGSAVSPGRSPGYVCIMCPSVP